MNSKILFISSLYTPNIGGGAEVILKDQVEGLAKAGYECIVLSTKESGGISIDTVNGIKVYRVGIKNIYWHYNVKRKNVIQKTLWHYLDQYNILMKKYVSEVIETEKPDIVICHNVTGWSIAVWDVVRHYNLPLIQVLHDMYFSCIKSTMFNGTESCKKQCMMCKIFRRKVANKSKNVNIVVGVSKFIVKKLTTYGYFSEARKEIIYNRRDLPKCSTIQEWDGKRSLIFGYIGSLLPTKGVELLIKAFSRLPNSLDIKLLIAGKGQEEYENYLKLLAKEDIRIEFIGHTTPSTFFSLIDLNVVPSLWDEPLGLVAIESCAFNTPVIASNVGGLPEIIEDNVNGKLINPDIDSLQNTIYTYYNNPDIVNRQIHNARKSVSSFLEYKRMIEEFSDLIKSTL